MWPRFGIKIGNSTLCIAYIKSKGFPEVIANSQGDRTSQACLLWSGGNEIECGLTAKQKMATRPKQAVANSFQILMSSENWMNEELLPAMKEIPCEYDSEENVFHLQLPMAEEGKGDTTKNYTLDLTPFEVHVRLLRTELELARQYYNNTSQKPCVVLSIPSYYPESSWDTLREVAEEAGFHVSQIIVEPTAALLAYNIGQNPSEEPIYILTIKSGGLFSHFSTYMVRNGLYSEMTSKGPFPIGGCHFTDVLIQFICYEFHKRYKLDPTESRRSMAKIKTAASNCKHILTTLPTTQIYIDSLMDGVDFNVQMSRARYESLIQPVINNFMQILNEFVEGAMRTFSIEKFDGIVLLGSTMQIPKLQAAISTRFPDAKLYNTMPDEAVAIGCALQAANIVLENDTDLTRTVRVNYVDEDVEIWHGADDSTAKLLIRRGTVLPHSKTIEISKNRNSSDEDLNQEEEIFHLRTGDRVTDVVLKNTVNQSDLFHLEAEFDFKRDSSRKLNIRLRSLQSQMV